VQVGVDLDNDSVLEAKEVTATSYVCNGGLGAPGLPAIPERQAAGAASLISIAAEAPGSHCEAGGTRFDVGMDINANAVLDMNEIQKTSYACNGSSAPEPAIDGGEANDGGADATVASLMSTLAVTGSAAEATVSWQVPAGATGFRVERWFQSDPECCRGSSPPLPATATAWFDDLGQTGLKVGIFAYQVTATYADRLPESAVINYDRPPPSAQPALRPRRSRSRRLSLSMRSSHSLPNRWSSFTGIQRPARRTTGSTDPDLRLRATTGRARRLSPCWSLGTAVVEGDDDLLEQLRRPSSLRHRRRGDPRLAGPFGTMAEQARRRRNAESGADAKDTGHGAGCERTLRYLVFNAWSRSRS